MKVELYNTSGNLLFATDVATDVRLPVGKALKEAIAQKVDVSEANLAHSDLSALTLSNLNLRNANLSYARLHGANLRGANLKDANLKGATITNANLDGAQLHKACLAGADLSFSSLRNVAAFYTNFVHARLAYVDLTQAYVNRARFSGNLKRADLTEIRDDVWAILSARPAEVPAFIAALKEGRVDGSTYTGKCMCLVGTLREESNKKADPGVVLPELRGNGKRPAEVFIAGVRPGDTPETDEKVKQLLTWCEDWYALMQAVFGAKQS